MTSQTFVISGVLPGLNDLLAEAKRFGESRGGRRWNGYASKKREWGEIVVAEIKAAKLRPIAGRVYLWFEWRAANQRTDPDNLSSFKKVALDSLVTAGILKSDGWRYITGWQETFVLDRAHPGVQVVLEEVGDG